MGAILFEMITKQRQFKDLTMMPEFVDQKLKDLVIRLLNENPKRRPSIDQTLSILLGKAVQSIQVAKEE